MQTPTSFGGLFCKVYDFNNLYRAFTEAAKGRRYTEDVLRFRSHLEENLINIQNSLVWHEWKPSVMHRFVIYEPKRREIAAPAFADRVVHHALVQIIEPLFERRFLSCSYACRSRKGTQAAVGAAQRYIREANAKYKNPYIFKGDMKSYFASIPHDVLKDQYRKAIRCKETLWLLDLIVDTGIDGDRGLPIGALTSQLLANVMLDPMDHFAKEHLKLKYYLRYMDDFVAICEDRWKAQEAFYELENYAEFKLGLKLNAKSGIFPLSKGLNFCGYRTWPTHRLPRKRNVRRMRRRIRALCKMLCVNKITKESVMQVWASFLGYMKHCNGHKTKVEIWREMNGILRRKE